jgi:hypothetical protein
MQQTPFGQKGNATSNGWCNYLPNIRRHMTKLPAWAMAGPERIDADGNACGAISSWPLIENATPPPMGEWIVRPAIWQANEHFDFAVSVFGSPLSRLPYVL